MATGRVNVGGTPFYNKLNNLQGGNNISIININKDFDFLTAIPLNIYTDEDTYKKVLTSETEINYRSEVVGSSATWYIIINDKASILVSKTSYSASIRPVFLHIEKNGTKAKLKFSFAVYDKPGVVGHSEYNDYFETEFDYTSNIKIYINNSGPVPLTTKNYLRIVAWKN